MTFLFSGGWHWYLPAPCNTCIHFLSVSPQVPVFPLHAQMEQRQRLKNLDRFKADDKCIIVATDVVGRGMDIKGVKYVVHYQFPRNTEVYVHRCGRTARAYKPGMAVTLLAPCETSNYKQVCFSLGYRHGLPAMTIDTHFLTSIKPVVQIAVDIDKAQSSRIKKKVPLVP